MEITFTREEQDKQELLEVFQQLNERYYPAILQWTHYDLAERSGIDDVERWKKFLLDPRIQAWLDEELSIHIKSQVFKMVGQSDANKSTAMVQTMNSFLNYLDKRETDPASAGPAFVYMFVPLTEAEEYAENVKKLDFNPFEEAMMK